jgi:hypothetical protein
MRNVCLAHDIFQRNPNYTLVLLPCPVGKPWLCVYTQHVQEASVEFSDKVAIFVCLQCLQSEPLICVSDVSARLTIIVLAHIHVWTLLVISATHALFTFGHEMPVQSFWYHFGTLSTINDLLYSNYAITLLLYQPSDARINWLEVCADCWYLSFSCIVLPTHPPPPPKKKVYLKISLHTWQNKINLPFMNKATTCGGFPPYISMYHKHQTCWRLSLCSHYLCLPHLLNACEDIPVRLL